MSETRVQFKCGHWRNLQRSTLWRGHWNEGSKFLNRCRPCDQAHKAFFSRPKAEQVGVCPCGLCQARAEKRNPTTAPASPSTP
jgi:hypothetical protein